MSWSIGYDNRWQRDIGYGVPAFCDHPGCWVEIDRGLSFVCGGQPYGGDHGCGLFFCREHLRTAGASRGYEAVCARCYQHKPPFEMTPDHPRWIQHQLTHGSWKKWRRENPELVERLRAVIQPQVQA